MRWISCDKEVQIQKLWQLYETNGGTKKKKKKKRISIGELSFVVYVTLRQAHGKEGERL